MELAPYLRLMVQRNGSDLYFSTSAVPHIKISGQTIAVGDQKMGVGDVSQLAYSIMNDEQIREFESTLECNLAISVQSLGRFRVNVFRQRGDVAMVIRFIKAQI
ncbi:MAG: pilus assembly protein PilU, partial [Gammaproteobacteria bacterium]|nr:pilus assembly protein PilU [Gammaproteobacteria bacterium]